MSAEMLRAGAQLEEPFTAMHLRERAGSDAKQAQNCITRWKINGMIKQVGRGEYRRLAKFGKHLVPIAPEQKPTGTLPTQLRKPEAAPLALPGEKVKTLAGAMKREALRLGTFTAEQLRAALDAKYGQEEMV